MCWLQSSDAFDRHEQVSSVPGNHLPTRPDKLPTTDQQIEFRQGTVESGVTLHHDPTVNCLVNWVRVRNCLKSIALFLWQQPRYSKIAGNRLAYMSNYIVVIEVRKVHRKQTQTDTNTSCYFVLYSNNVLHCNKQKKMARQNASQLVWTFLASLSMAWLACT